MRRLFMTLLIVSIQAIASENASLIKILADHDQYPSEEVQAAFQTLCAFSPKTEPHFFSYCKPEEITTVGEVSSSLYGEIVQSMTISCVDVFIFNFERNAYFMVKRKDPPAQGEWWLPGGRVFKGESFYESAKRKAKNEGGLEILPLAQLGTYTTYFTESAWGQNVPTDTKNTVILALCNDQESILDTHHQDSCWVPIDEAPLDPYVLSAYTEAKTKLSQWGFLPTI